MNHSRNGVIKPVPDAIPAALRELDQWVLWKLEERDSGGKPTKRPYNARDLRPASPTDPKTWSAFSKALRRYQSGGWDGVGFVFAEGGGFVGVDIDDCRNPETGELLPWAKTILSSLNTYCEVSPSGTGVKAIARGTLAEPGRRKGKLEMYGAARYFTVTGAKLEGCSDAVEHRQKELEDLYAARFSTPVDTSPREASSDTAAKLEDDAVIKLAAGGANGEKFRSLFENGDTTPYGGDHSRADQALCNILAFYTRDEEQIDRVFQHSALNREKWGRRDYRERTIRRALQDTPESYSGDSGKMTLHGKQSTEGGGAAEYALSDLGNSERFADQHSSALRFVEEFSVWYAWNGAVWELSKGEALERAKRTARAIYDEASRAETLEKRGALAKHAVASESGRALREMVSLAASTPRIRVKPDDLDADLWALNTPSGILDLRSGKLEPHNPAKLFTRITAAPFDSAAPCPTFQAFVTRIFGGDEELISYVQRAIGSALVGENLDQRMFIANGNGANGKSTLLSAVSFALGEYARTTPSETFMWRRERGIPNDLAALKGARFVVSSEGSEGRRLAEDLVKLVTGGDKVAARFMRGEFFEFTPQFSLYFQTNHLPAVSGNDHGIWRRLAVIPFAVTIPQEERDSRLPERLRAEASGILAWAVRGCLEWQRHGLGTARAVEEASRHYREENDSLGDFLLERCDVGRSLEVSASDLYANYRAWSGERGEFAMTMNAFSRRLADRSFWKRRSTGGKVFWSGVQLRAGLGGMVVLSGASRDHAA